MEVIDLTKNIILAYLNNGGNPTTKGLFEITNIIQSTAKNDYSVLLEHAKAMRNVFNDAIELMEKERRNDKV